jgi:hypothetical protein
MMLCLVPSAIAGFNSHDGVMLSETGDVNSSNGVTPLETFELFRIMGWRIMCKIYHQSLLMTRARLR